MKKGLTMLVLAVMVGGCSPMVVTHYDGRAVIIRWERGIGEDNNAASVQARASEVCGGPVQPLLIDGANRWGLVHSHFLCISQEQRS